MLLNMCQWHCEMCKFSSSIPWLDEHTAASAARALILSRLDYTDALVAVVPDEHQQTSGGVEQCRLSSV